MNRLVFALAASVLGLGMMGCATSVDDPVPPQPAPEAQRDPPQQALNGELRPQPLQVANIDNNGAVNAPAAKQRPPVPTPTPFAEER